MVELSIKASGQE